MIVLKQVIKYDNANALEATWVDRVLVPAIGEEGDEDYQSERIEEVVVRCHAYADCQMDELEADLGADAATYADLIAEVRAAYVPPAPEPVAVPDTVTRFQAKAALHLAGLLPQVEALMQHPDTPMLAKLAWIDAVSFKRNSPTVVALSQLLSLTNDQLDTLFIQASQIEA